MTQDLNLSVYDAIDDIVYNIRNTIIEQKGLMTTSDEADFVYEHMHLVSGQMYSMINEMNKYVIQNVDLMIKLKEKQTSEEQLSFNW